jgi:putative flippase GtrA
MSDAALRAGTTGGDLAARLRRLVVDLIGYGSASAAALGLDMAVLLVLTEVFGLHYLWAAAAGFLTGMALVYVISIRLVFSDRRHLAQGSELASFMAIGFAGLLLSVLLMFGLVDLAGLAVPVAKILTAGLVFTFNFLLRRAIVFSAAG